MANLPLVSCIDIGNSYIRVLIAQADPEKKVPQIIGVGVSPSNGMRRGHVIDVGETIQSITSALEKAERMAGETVHQVIVGVNGTHLHTTISKGVVAINGEEITEEDVTRVLETAQAISLPQNTKILKVIPKSFTIDNSGGIKYPVGMVGKKLEVEAHILSIQNVNLRNIEKCIHESGVDIVDIIPTLISAPEAVLTKRQKELGVIVIDVGCGATGVTIYEEGSMISSEIVPIGGEMITNDLAIGLRVSVDIAEKIKIEYGSCRLEEKNNKVIELTEFSPQDHRRFTHNQVTDIITARMEEIFMQVKSHLRKIGKDGMLPAGAVLVGSSIKLPGTIEIARDTLKLPVSIGFPLESIHVLEKVDDPSFASSIGLLMWGVSIEPKKGNLGIGFGNFNMPEFMKKIPNMFKKIIS